MFPVPWSSRWSWSLHLFLGRPMFLRPFGLYCGACFGSLFVSNLCTCCSHFFWYCFISFTMFCAPVFSLIHWIFSLSSFVIRSKCLKNVICAASKRCSSHKRCFENKILFVSSWPSVDVQLAIRCKDKQSLCGSSVRTSCRETVATTCERNELRGNKNPTRNSEHVCVLALFVRRGNRNFSTQHYTAICSPPRSAIFFPHCLTNGTIFEEKCI